MISSTNNGVNIGNLELTQATTDKSAYGDAQCVNNTQTHGLNALYASASDDLPLPQPDETKKRRKWLEGSFFKSIAIREILSLATAARNGEHKCRFRERTAGGYSVVIFLVFDDGVEWAAKLPKGTREENDGRNEYLESECATLMFLQQLGTVPSPKLHDFASDHNNPVKSPYILMDKVVGTPLIQSLGNGMRKEAIHETLRQLAQVRRSLLCNPFWDIGSLVVVDDPKTRQFDVDKQLTISNYGSFCPYSCRPGPYPTSMAYYTNLLCASFLEWQEIHPLMATQETVKEKWKIYAYLCSILPSYVKDDNDQFFLAHTDLSASNILVDENGSITGIIDWEFANTLPFQAVEHYPLFLADKEHFVGLMEDLCDDPLAELEEWRAIYAKEFKGDANMEEYLENIDVRIAFEKILHDYEEATLENLVENFKLLESAAVLDRIENPFRWTSPTEVHHTLADHEQTSAMKDSKLSTIPLDCDDLSIAGLGPDSPSHSLKNLLDPGSPADGVHTQQQTEIQTDSIDCSESTPPPETLSADSADIADMDKLRIQTDIVENFIASTLDVKSTLSPNSNARPSSQPIQSETIPPFLSPPTFIYSSTKEKKDAAMQTDSLEIPGSLETPSRSPVVNDLGVLDPIPTSIDAETQPLPRPLSLFRCLTGGLRGVMRKLKHRASRVFNACSLGDSAMDLEMR